MPRTTIFCEAELPPALESRIPVYFWSGPASSKQFVQFTCEPIEVVVIAARVEIFEPVFTPNQIVPHLPGVAPSCDRSAKSSA